MSPQDWTKRLHREIPISQAMGVRCLVAEAATVRLQVPLTPNVNHQMTAFGGSLYSVGVLACWTLANAFLESRGKTGLVLVTDARIQYLKPVSGDFEASATWEAPLEALIAQIEKKGKGRGRARCSLSTQGNVCAELSGEFWIKT